MNRIFFFVEGSNDETFLKRIIQNKLESSEIKPIFYKYAQQRLDEVDTWLHFLESNSTYYMFLADSDKMKIQQKKNDLIKKYPMLNHRKDRIVIVVVEIESWYLAGITQKTSEILSITPPSTTDDITKEGFRKIILGGKISSIVGAMNIMLEDYDTSLARTRNSSFKYFADKIQNKLGVVI